MASRRDTNCTKNRKEGRDCKSCGCGDGEKAVWEVVRMWTDGIKRNVGLWLVIFDRI